jgi:hypothetical protein
MIIYRIAAAAVLVLEIAERCGFHLEGLPYGGSPLAQLGSALGIAFVITEAKAGLMCIVRSMRIGLCTLIRECRAFLKEVAASLGSKTTDSGKE